MGIRSHSRTSLLTSIDRSLHQTALETSQQSLVHEELSFAAGDGYNHLGFSQCPLLVDKTPRLANTIIFAFRRCVIDFRLVQY